MRQYFKRSNDLTPLVIWYEENGVRIPFTNSDPANTDYQAYLAWVAEGNTAKEWEG